MKNRRTVFLNELVAPIPLNSYEQKRADRMAENQAQLLAIFPAILQAAGANKGKRDRKVVASGKENGEKGSPSPEQPARAPSVRNAKRMEQEAAAAAAKPPVAPCLTAAMALIPHPTGPPAAAALYGPRSGAAKAMPMAKVKPGLNSDAAASQPESSLDILTKKLGPVMGKHIFDSIEAAETASLLQLFWSKTNADQLSHNRIITIMKAAPGGVYTLRLESIWFDSLFSK